MMFCLSILIRVNVERTYVLHLYEGEHIHERTEPERPHPDTGQVYSLAYLTTMLGKHQNVGTNKIRRCNPHILHFNSKKLYGKAL